MEITNGEHIIYFATYNLKTFVLCVLIFMQLYVDILDLIRRQLVKLKSNALIIKCLYKSYGLTLRFE